MELTTRHSASPAAALQPHREPPPTGSASRAQPSPQLVALVERRRVEAQFELVAVDGTAAVTTVQVALWGARGRSRRAFSDEVLAIHSDLHELARTALPPAPHGVLVEVLAPEPAMFERVARRDAVRLRIRAWARSRGVVTSWAHALWANLRACQVKVEPATWPTRAPQAGDGDEAPPRSGA